MPTPPRLSGSANGRWKGGTWINSKGYVMVLVGREHPMATCRQYAPRCRLVCYETHGLPEPGQHAHHIDGDKQNDAPENLEWRWPTDHSRHHLSSERARELGRKGGKAVARLRRRAAEKAAKQKVRVRRTPSNIRQSDETHGVPPVFHAASQPAASTIITPF